MTNDTNYYIDLLHSLDDKHTRSIFVVLLEPAQQTVIEHLAGTNLVTGIIFQDKADAGRYQGTINTGYVHDNLRDWTLPSGNCDLIVVFKQRHAISFAMLCRALARGIKTIAYIQFDKLRQESVPPFIKDLVINKCYQVLPYRLFPPFMFASLQEKLDKTVNNTEVPFYPASEFKHDRICLVNSSLLWGGAERQIVNTLTGLKEHGLSDITMLCQRIDKGHDNDFYLDMLQEKNIHVLALAELIKKETNDHSLSNETFSRLTTLLDTLPNQLAVAIADYFIAFSRLKPGIVHIWQDTNNITAGLAAYLAGVPRILLSTRNLAPVRFHYRQPYYHPGYTALLRLNNVTLLNNSHAGADDYANWLNIDRSCIKVLHNGVDEEIIRARDKQTAVSYRQQLDIPDDCRVIGSVFRFYMEKDPLLWFNTARMIAKERNDCVFLLVGTGPLLDDIKLRVKQKNLENRFFFVDPVKDVTLPLSIIDIFLLTSRHEGTPNVVIEAQLCNVPVVATDAGGTADTFQHGVTGWLVKERSPASLSERVQYCLDNKDWFSRAKTEARQYAIDTFSMHTMIENTLTSYGLADNKPDQE